MKTNKIYGKTHQELPLEDTILNFKNVSDLEKFLVEVLTPAEVIMLNRRFTLLQKLWRGETHRQISKDLRVGVGTIERGVRVLEQKNGIVRQIFRKFYGQDSPFQKRRTQ